MIPYILSLVIFLFAFFDQWAVFWKRLMTPVWLWFALGASIIMLVIGIGIGKHGIARGAFVDTRNKVSLSRLQILLWTILIFSAIGTIGLTRTFTPKYKQVDKVEYKYYSQMLTEDEEAGTTNAQICFPEQYLKEHPQDENMGDGQADAAAAEAPPAMVTVAEDCRDTWGINLPGELLAVLGISTLSVTGSLIIKNDKAGKKEDLTDLENKLKAQDDDLKIKTKALTDVVGEFSKAVGRKNELENKLKGLGDGEELSADEKQELTVLGDVKTGGSLKEYKTKIASAQAEVDSAQDAYNETKNTLDKKKQQNSIIVTNNNAGDSKWSDIFDGEETSNVNYIDIGKVQMFILTVVLILGYASSIHDMILIKFSVFSNPLGLTLPKITSGMTTLLAISHAGYLGLKYSEKTKTE